MKIYLNGILVDSSYDVVVPGNNISYPLRVGYSGRPHA